MNSKGAEQWFIGFVLSQTVSYYLFTHAFQTVISCFRVQCAYILQSLGRTQEALALYNQVVKNRLVTKPWPGLQIGVFKASSQHD